MEHFLILSTHYPKIEKHKTFPSSSTFHFKIYIFKCHMGLLCFKGAMIESYLILVLLIFEDNKLRKVKKEVVVETGSW